MPKLFYLVPDNERPSWGVGVIYHHVKALLELGYDAVLLHETPGFQLSWLQMDVPIEYIGSLDKKSIGPRDVVVVPEVMANHPLLSEINARKVLFVQGGSLVFHDLPIGVTYQSLGFRSVMVIMPHLVPIIEQFVGLPVFMVSPMVADYFYEGSISVNREKSIVMYPKYAQVDFTIVNGLLRRKTGSNRLKKALGFDWRIKLLQGLSHRDVAKVFDKASFFISLNTFEALNTSIVEAMARGCIVLCYEGFGPRDFLEDGKNAFVFGNNEPYQLVSKLYDILDHPGRYAETLEQMRQNALATARRYTYAVMKQELAQNIEKIFGE